MWYSAYTGNFISCYATSPDKVHWCKPDLGLRAHEGTEDNNIFAIGDPAGDVYRNPNPAPNDQP
jgi:hypothetical protein